MDALIYSMIFEMMSFRDIVVFISCSKKLRADYELSTLALQSKNIPKTQLKIASPYQVKLLSTVGLFGSKLMPIWCNQILDDQLGVQIKPFISWSSPKPKSDPYISPFGLHWDNMKVTSDREQTIRCEFCCMIDTQTKIFKAQSIEYWSGSQFVNCDSFYHDCFDDEDDCDICEHLYGWNKLPILKLMNRKPSHWDIDVLGCAANADICTLCSNIYTPLKMFFLKYKFQNVSRIQIGQGVEMIGGEAPTGYFAGVYINNN